MNKKTKNKEIMKGGKGGNKGKDKKEREEKEDERVAQIK
jgi:hypothetical protein